MYYMHTCTCIHVHVHLMPRFSLLKSLFLTVCIKIVYSAYSNESCRCVMIIVTLWFSGDVTVRTHTSKRVVNKLSRFHTTAGMESFSHSHSQSQNLHNSTLAHTPSSASASSSPPTFDQREFPSSFSSVSTGAVNSVSGGGSDWNNPRALPLPSPVCVTALQQVKQPYLTNSECNIMFVFLHGPLW